jgi:hypothetical protein
MAPSTCGSREAIVAAAALAASAFLAVTANASAATTCLPPPPGTLPPNAGAGSNVLNGVTVTSSCNAWAAGSSSGKAGSRTLIERWNGVAWKLQSSPSPAGATLQAISALSATNAWAVGYYFAGKVERTLIEHWNGRAWRRVPSPNPGSRSQSDRLMAVTVTSRTSALAVGIRNVYDIKGTQRTLVERWNGKAWRVVASPNANRHDNELESVTATSRNNAWAGGNYLSQGESENTLIEHWNGKAWRIVKSANSSGQAGGIFGFSARSAGDAWAFHVGGGFGGKFLHWNGSTWSAVPASPDLTDFALFSVAGVSSTSAWAVGNTFGSAVQTVLEVWDGTHWEHIGSPDPGGLNQPNGFSAVAARSFGGWAVGTYSNGSAFRTLAVPIGDWTRS